MKVKTFIKQNSEPGDSHENGSIGFILGEFDSPPELIKEHDVKKAYACVYEVNEDLVVCTVDKKLNISDDIVDQDISEKAQEMYEEYCSILPFKSYK